MGKKTYLLVPGVGPAHVTWWHVVGKWQSPLGAKNIQRGSLLAIPGANPAWYTCLWQFFQGWILSLFGGFCCGKTRSETFSFYDHVSFVTVRTATMESPAGGWRGQAITKPCLYWARGILRLVYPLPWGNSPQRRRLRNARHPKRFCQKQLQRSTF